MDEAIKFMQDKDEVKTEAGCEICLGNAKLIFESKAEYQALEIILNSNLKPKIKKLQKKFLKH